MGSTGQFLLDTLGRESPQSEGFLPEEGRNSPISEKRQIFP
jgi:hypothetical protein